MCKTQEDCQGQAQLCKVSPSPVTFVVASLMAELMEGKEPIIPVDTGSKK